MSKGSIFNCYVSLPECTLFERIKHCKIWVVVSNISYVHPYLGKIPILTSIFFKGVVQPPPKRADLSFSWVKIKRLKTIMPENSFRGLDDFCWFQLNEDFKPKFMDRLQCLETKMMLKINQHLSLSINSFLLSDLP